MGQGHQGRSAGAPHASVGSVKGFGDFKDDRGLTQEELEIISDLGGRRRAGGRCPSSFRRAETGKWQDPGARGRVRNRCGCRASGCRARNDALSPCAPKISKRARACRSSPRVPTGPSSRCCGFINSIRISARTYYYKSPVALPAGTQDRNEPVRSGQASGYSPKHSPSRLRQATGADERRPFDDWTANARSICLAHYRLRVSRYTRIRFNSGISGRSNRSRINTTFVVTVFRLAPNGRLW